MNLITKKLRDVTPKEYHDWAKRNCDLGKCVNCPFYFVNCNNGESNGSWLLHKDLYSDKFLDQIITVEVPLLDEEEKKYLSAVIKPFRNKIVYITKMINPFNDREKIVIYYKQYHNSIKCFELPDFKGEIMYKNMRLAQTYKLEDLGL